MGECAACNDERSSNQPDGQQQSLEKSSRKERLPEGMDPNTGNYVRDSSMLKKMIEDSNVSKNGAADELVIELEVNLEKAKMESDGRRPSFTEIRRTVR